MYIGSKEDEHLSLGEDMKDELEDMMYVSIVTNIGRCVRLCTISLHNLSPAVINYTDICNIS